MKHTWLSILLVTLLLGLVGLLATLQYTWLREISDSQRERLQKSLETDTGRFAEDFNREIQNAYFPFQLETEVWRDKDFARFTEHYQAWRANAAHPSLISDFYFVGAAEAFRYDFDKHTFVECELTPDLATLRENSAANFQPIDEKNLRLVMPIYEDEKNVFIPQGEMPLRFSAPRLLGFLIIKLDEGTLKNKVLPDLVQKYFPDGEYRLEIESQSDSSSVFRVGELARQSADASRPLFDLSPSSLALFVNRDLLSTLKEAGTRKLVLNERFEKRVPPTTEGTSKTGNFKIEVLSGQKQRIFQRSGLGDGGVWLLNVQHAQGSLEKFVANTYRKNLAVSFGTLLLLAVSIILIFISAQRAKVLAQRQIDFVSAVSHEFRTPLAVIYSAGENLTDGIVRSEKQVAKYGNLIKGEGKKLSAMVEQILEFAGARSGRKKYDLRETDVRDIVENALAECQPLLEEKGFAVETEIADNLPKISADKSALSHAVQNLIINAVKYGNGNRWLKISAENGGETVKVSVEDKGIGIAQKDVSKIFAPFYRAKAVVDAQIHGNGLGLSLVKQTVEAHGGKVFVKSEEGKGSKFTIHLPLNT